jgi:hypothetical protein
MRRFETYVPALCLLALFAILALIPYPRVEAQGALSRIAGVSPLTGKDVPYHATAYGWTGCDSHVAISGNTAATTQLVAGTTTTRVHICGFLIDGAAATTVQVVRGTGSSCTSSTAITGVMTLATGTPIAYDGGSNGSIAVTGVGESVCWINSGAVQVSGTLTYTQY